MWLELAFDVHPRPDAALCHGSRTLITDDLAELVTTFREPSSRLARDVAPPPAAQDRVIDPAS